MSLHYGVSKRTRNGAGQNLRVINYQLYFSRLLRIGNSTPHSVIDGYPTFRLFCKGHHPDGGFKILTHRFDDDDFIVAPFVLKFSIRVCLSDGTVQLHELADIDYYAFDIYRCETTYFLEKEFKFKDIPVLGSHKIQAFDLIFTQTSGGYYGNESVMDIVVDY